MIHRNPGWETPILREVDAHRTNDLAILKVADDADLRLLAELDAVSLNVTPTSEMVGHALSQYGYGWSTAGDVSTCGKLRQAYFSRS